jgi:hypothetical protein
MGAVVRKLWASVVMVMSLHFFVTGFRISSTPRGLRAVLLCSTAAAQQKERMAIYLIVFFSHVVAVSRLWLYATSEYSLQYQAVHDGRRAPTFEPRSRRAFAWCRRPVQRPVVQL